MVAAYLRCGRKFQLRYVEKRKADHYQTGYAAQIGTAVHAAVAEGLVGIRSGNELSRNQLEAVMLEAFEESVYRAHSEGATTDPERIAPAIDRMVGPEMDRVMALMADPRIRSVNWFCIEQNFSWEDGHGRTYRGTLDAGGVCEREFVLGCGTAVLPGDILICDWKTGDAAAIDYPSRRGNVQLAFYELAVFQAGMFKRHNASARVHLILGKLVDYDHPKRPPRDDQGNVIPSKLKMLNPEYIAAYGQMKGWNRTKSLEQATAAMPERLQEIETSRRQLRRGNGERIPKRIELENPAYLEACSKPKGPVLHRCEVDRPLTRRTIAHAIRGAEQGLFPASGALNGTCTWCEYKQECPDSDTQGAPFPAASG